MPGVGITDARRILEHVAERPGQVRASVALQLLSAACCAPALAGAGRPAAARALGLGVLALFAAVQAWLGWRLAAAVPASAA
jgi:hypothetical protein